MADKYQDPHMYKAPPGDISNPPSTVGEQIRVDYWYRRALVEAAKESYFSQMADVRAMPKNMGKTIKQYQYLPILDDRNINDQGIDAQGHVTKDLGTDFVANKTAVQAVIKVMAPSSEAGRNLYADALAAVTNKAYDHPDLPETLYFSGSATGADLATAAGAAQGIAEGKANDFLAMIGVTGVTYSATVVPRDATTWKAHYVVHPTAGTATGSVSGNMYGSAKDIGSIIAKLPVLSESGGRVNRVGMTRRVLEGSFEKFGFFEEYTQESMDFDTDSELLGHITGEAVKAANEITEDTLQIDLLNSAGIVRYTGMAAKTGDIDTVVDYDDLIKLGVEMDNNRTPKNTRIIAGSRMIDTRVVNSARFIYIGSELIPTMMRMTDYHGEAAFIPVSQYTSAGNTVRGELGAVGDFRIIVVPEMMHWEGAGKAATTAKDGSGTAKPAHSDGTNLNIYPMLVVGDGSFTTIGFQTNGKTIKFTITHKKPGREMATRNDPFGETGFYSIKWYYGFMPLRPERIALLKTPALY